MMIMLACGAGGNAVVTRNQESVTERVITKTGNVEPGGIHNSERGLTQTVLPLPVQGSKARSWINVKEFAGARGDGTTDDTEKINSAITAAAGGVLYFPKGTYIVRK